MKSLLRRLATQRSETTPIEVRYDNSAQVSEVLESGRWIKSWESKLLLETKKCDIETGEDQKGT
jgi:hypothetical protein